MRIIMCEAIYDSLDLPVPALSDNDGAGVQTIGRIAYSYVNPTASVRMVCSDAIAADIEAGNDPNYLYIAEMGSPVKERDVSAQEAKAMRDWLLDAWPPPRKGGFGQAMSAINSARKGRDIARVITEQLHDTSLEKAEGGR